MRDANGNLDVLNSGSLPMLLVTLGCYGLIIFGLINFWDGGPHLWGLAVAFLAAFVWSVTAINFLNKEEE